MTSKLKELTKKYGSIAIGTYLAISLTTTVTAFVAVENNLDLEALLTRVLGEDVDVAGTLKAWGLSKARMNEIEDGPRTMYSSVMSKAPSVVLALLTSKLLIPVKIPLAAVLTPTVSRFLVSRNLIKPR